MAKHAHRPLREGVRAMEIFSGSEEDFCGENNIRINPFLRGDEPLWPLNEERADFLAWHSFALSLTEALKRKLSADEQRAILVYLLEIVRLSDVAKDELNRIGELPLRIQHGQNMQLAQEIDTLCQNRRQETGWEDTSEDWSSWATRYCFWIRDGHTVHRLSISGADKQLASYDFSGKHLTGGRVWAASVLLLQWYVPPAEPHVLLCEARVCDIILKISS